jgi:hypothetical protein
MRNLQLQDVCGEVCSSGRKVLKFQAKKRADEISGVAVLDVTYFVPRESLVVMVQHLVMPHSLYTSYRMSDIAVFIQAMK